MKAIGEGLALIIIGIPGFILVFGLFAYLWQEYGFAGVLFPGMILWLFVLWAIDKTKA